MAGCGEMIGIGRRCPVIERGMRSGCVVVGNPGNDDLPSLIEVEKQALVEKFVTHTAVEGFHIAVLHRLAGCDVVRGVSCFGRGSRVRDGGPDVMGEGPDRHLGDPVHDRPVQSGAQAAQRRPVDPRYREHGGVFPGRGELDVGVQSREQRPLRDR